MKNRPILILILCLYTVSSIAQKNTVTTQTLLEEMSDIASIARWPEFDYREYQASSYDRRSVAEGQPGWYANDDRSQYIRTETVNGRKENVMMDADGPGAIVRFWLTTFKRNGTIRIYFDNKPEPEIVIPAYDLMQSGLKLGKALLQAHSSYEPREKGGSTLYLPMPYAKHCKITFEDKDTDFQPRYYQVNYRTYAAGTKIRTFTWAEFNSLQNLADIVNNKLMDTGNKEPFMAVNSLLGNGQRANLKASGSSSRAVRYLAIKIVPQNGGNYEQALRTTVLRIKFDGEETVWCPLGDFAGAGVGAKPLKSWYRTITEDSTLISRWIMPYKNSVEIQIYKRDTGLVKTSVTMLTTAWKWDNKTSMYFHADWKAENNVAIKHAEKENPVEWTLNSITGKGVFVGDALAVNNHMHKWYGEGDQKLWVDDAPFPAEYGTGAEDYYNTSWAPVVLYQTPFANAPRADNADSFGHNTFTRTRDLDAVPFTKNFTYKLEMLGWDNGTADISAVTYWYGFKGTKSSAATNKSTPTALLTEE